MTEESYHEKYTNRVLGTILRDIRESKSLLLQAIALRLKIDRKYIEALENDDYSVFPAHVYARGVFEKYADFLGLDREEALRLFEHAWQEKRTLCILPSISRSKKSLLKILGNHILKKTIIGGMVGVGLLVVGSVGVWIAMGEMSAFTFDEPADRSITHERYSTIRGTADPRIELTLNKQPVYIGENGLFRRDVLLHAGINTLVLEGKTRFGKLSRSIKHIVVE